ncbi:MAG: hypothetical protein AAGI54_13590, partial [Planctomycetota bacterium]
MCGLHKPGGRGRHVDRRRRLYRRGHETDVCSGRHRPRTTPMRLWIDTLIALLVTAVLGIVLTSGS